MTRFFVDDIFRDDSGDRPFVSFLARLRAAVTQDGGDDILRTCLLVRKKIKAGVRLSWQEINTLQQLGLRHWRGADISSLRMQGMDGVDLRDTDHANTVII